MSHPRQIPDSHRRTTGKARALLRSAHSAFVRAAMVLSGVLRVLPVIGRLDGRVRYWIAYVSLVYFVLYWTKQGLVALIA